MMRLVAVGMAIPTIFAAWAGAQLSTAQAADQTASGDKVTVVGCLARQTPDGAVPTPEQPRDNSMPLLLTKARAVDPAAKGGAPGTSPSANDTGTIAGAIVRTPTPGSVRERSFTLAGGDAATLAKEVGQRIEVVGTVSRSSGPSAPPKSGAHTTTDTAHPSAPVERLTVISFRPIGGACL